MRSFAHKDIKLSWKNKQKGVKNEFLLFYVGFRLHAESSFSSSVPGCPACRNGTATGGLHATDRRGRTCGRFGQVTPCVIKALMADDTFCMYFVGNIELLSSQITDYAINSKLTEGLSLCNLLKQRVTSESAGISNEFSGRLFIFNCRRGCKLG